jgi:hypothetical protein
VPRCLKVFTGLACSLILFLPLSGFCQSASDWHLTSPQYVLYQRSVYAHGYIHGYEQGFHNGDLDVHMGRGQRPLSELKDYRELAGYRKGFGDKGFFKRGYEQGFRQGYKDAVSGRAFRAIAEARSISESMPQTGNLPEHDFDVAFSHGYDAGRQAASRSDAHQVGIADKNGICAAGLPQSEAGNKAAFCDAFSRGFLLGFSDAHVRRPDEGTETARNTFAVPKQ